MTNDIEALNDFKVVDKPTDIGYETPYMKIARACKLLATDKAIELPVSFFKTKNYRPSISNAGKRLGIKIKSVVKNGVVFIFKK
jgi:hypothetical protein